MSLYSKVKMSLHSAFGMFANADYAVQMLLTFLNLSERQVQRLMNRFRQSGASGLTHQSRGKPGNNHISNDYRHCILKIVREYYADFTPMFAREKLLEQHNLPISKETLQMDDRGWSLGTTLTA